MLFIYTAKIRSRRKRLHDEMIYDQLQHQQQHQQLLQQQQQQQHDVPSLVRQVAVNGHKDGVYLQPCLVCHMSLFLNTLLRGRPIIGRITGFARLHVSLFSVV